MNSVISVSAINASGTSTTSLTIVVQNAPPGLPYFTSPSTATATVGQPFSYQMAATNNPTNYFVTIQSGTGTEPPNSSLPPGITYNTNTGLISGTPTASGTYSNSVTLGAVNASGPSYALITLIISGSGGGGGVPAAPTGLTPTAGNSQVSLVWNSSAGATSYNVYRGTSPSGESAVPIANGLATAAYTDSGLTNNSTYYYKVAAVNTSGTSSFSTEANATPVGSGPPAVPANFAAYAGNAQVTLSWSASAGATSYNLYRSTLTNEEGNTPVATGITSTTYVDLDLLNGPTDYYKLAAVNSSGTSGFSSEASATPSASLTNQITYYQDSFNRTGDLNGSKPTVDTNGNTWSVTAGNGGGYSTNGGVATVSGTIYAFNESCLPVNGASGVTLDGSKDFTLSVGLTTSTTGQFGIFLSVSGSPGSLFGASLASIGTGGYLAAYVYNQGLINYDFATAIPSPTVSLAYSATGGTLTYTVGGTVVTTATGVTLAQIAAIRSVGIGDQGYGGGDGAPTPTFNNFTLTVGAGSSSPATPTGLTAISGTAVGQIALSWGQSAGAVSYILERSTSSNAGYSPIATLAASTVTYTDTSSSLVAGQTFYYEIAVASASGTSAFSSDASATPYVPASFAGWAYSYFGLNASASVAGDMAMPANDGIPNLLKYALGLDPLTPGTVTETVSQSGSTWLFKFQRPANRPDLTYTVQVSPTLAPGSWTSTGVSLSETVSGDPETWQASYTPTSGSKLFFRLQVTGP